VAPTWCHQNNALPPQPRHLNHCVQHFPNKAYQQCHLAHASSSLSRHRVLVAQQCKPTNMAASDVPRIQTNKSLRPVLVDDYVGAQNLKNLTCVNPLIQFARIAMEQRNLLYHDGVNVFLLCQTKYYVYYYLPLPAESARSKQMSSRFLSNIHQ